MAAVGLPLSATCRATIARKRKTAQTASQVGPSGRRNSRCMRSTIGVKASLAIFRSAWPNFVPRSSQFTSRRDFGVMPWIITPTKSSQPGADLTASVIANSSSSAVLEIRLSLLHHLFGAAAGVWSIKGCASSRSGSEDEELVLVVFRFAAGFDTVARENPRVGAFRKYLCKISKSSASQTPAPGIKIQVDIAPLLRFRKACSVMHRP